MTEIIIYSKPGCHLCDEAKDVLREVAGQVPFALTEVNIAADPALLERYQYDIPVLFASLPMPVRFLAKRNLFRLPVLGWAMTPAGSLPAAHHILMPVKTRNAPNT